MAATLSSPASSLEPQAQPREPAAIAGLSGRLHSIDFLRGLAAIAVLIGHMATWGDKLPAGIWGSIAAGALEIGARGVPLFFVISGFCIHLAWARATARDGLARIAFVPFWKRRFRRLYPPYFVMLCLSMGFLVLALLLHREVPALQAYPQPRARWMAGDFLAHVFMLHGLYPVFDKGAGNAVFWTLAREEYFYLLYFPLLALRGRLGLWPTLGVLAVLSIAFPLIFLPLAPDREWRNLIYSSAPTLWIQWALGMASVEAYFGLVKLPSAARALWLAPILFAGGIWAHGHAVLLEPLLFGLAFFLLVNWCVAREKQKLWAAQPGLARSIINWFTATGVFSYSIYLTHQLSRSVLKQALGPLGRSHNPILYFGVAIVLSVAAYFLALAFFHLIEKRFLNTPSRVTPSGEVA